MREILGTLIDLKARLEPWRFPAGATADEILEAEGQLNSTIDEDYKALLRFSNGPCIGGDGSIRFYSVAKYGPDSIVDLIDDDARRALRLPITSDGCGNQYQLMTVSGMPGRPVAFFEMSVSASQPAYLAASSLTTFFKFWVGNSGYRMDDWPFTPALFDRVDPDLIKHAPHRLLPWNA